jgi:hypothetical protein
MRTTAILRVDFSNEERNVRPFCARKNLSEITGSFQEIRTWFREEAVGADRADAR